MTAKTVTCFLLWALVGCTSSSVWAERQDSTSLFVILGMLDDYAARKAYVGDSLVGDMKEKSHGDIFCGYLDQLRADLNLKGAIRREILREGGIRFYSKELAAVVDSCFVFDYSRSVGNVKVEGRWVAWYYSQKLKPELIVSACTNDSYGLAFLRGVYLTNGQRDILIHLDRLHSKGEASERDPIQRAYLSFTGYSFYKADLTDSLLRHFNCQNIDFSEHGGCPGRKEIYFNPSATIVSRVMLPAIEEYGPYRPAPCRRQ